MHVIATFFWIACGKGLDTATRNMLCITAKLERWSELYGAYRMFAVVRVTEMYHLLSGTRRDDLKNSPGGHMLEEEEAQVALFLLDKDIMGSEPQMVEKAVRVIIPF
jgi:hypothetical protein